MKVIRKAFLYGETYPRDCEKKGVGGSLGGGGGGGGLATLLLVQNNIVQSDSELFVRSVLQSKITKLLGKFMNIHGKNLFLKNYRIVRKLRICEKFGRFYQTLH